MELQLAALRWQAQHVIFIVELSVQVATSILYSPFSTLHSSLSTPQDSTIPTEVPNAVNRWKKTRLFPSFPALCIPYRPQWSRLCQELNRARGPFKLFGTLATWTTSISCLDQGPLSSTLLLAGICYCYMPQKSPVISSSPFYLLNSTSIPLCMVSFTSQPNVCR